MIQNNEFSIIKLVISYLIDLGYYESDIHANVHVKNKNCDLVIYEGDKPRIVFEVRLDISNINELEIRFNPLVSELQYKASVLGAEYYALTDGKNYSWFKNDKYGRPELLEVPVYKVDRNSRKDISKNSISQAIKKIRFYLGNNSRDTNELLLIILIAWIEDKNGSSYLKEELTDGRGEDALISLISYRPSMELSNYKGDTMAQVFHVLNDIDLSQLEFNEVLRSIDDELFSNFDSLNPRLPRWLSDFIVKLVQVKENSKLLSISSSYGDIPVAFSKFTENSFENRINVIDYDRFSFLYSILQQVIVGYQLSNFNYLCRSIYEFPNNADITDIILLPSFGLNGDVSNYDSYLISNGIRRNEDLLLEYSIKQVKKGGRIVTVLPDSLLYSGGSRKITREFMINNARISAVISLPLGTILRFGKTKVSIVVLDIYEEDIINSDYEIFMADIKDYIMTDTFNCYDLFEVKSILSLYENRQPLNYNSDQKNVKRVKFSDLEDLSLSANSYIDDEMNIDKSLYNIVNLSDITLRIKRGKRIKIDKQGDYYFIGPAAIRPMMILTNKLDITTLDNLGATDISVRQGDLVFNNIGSYLGAAAVVDNNMDDKAVSQHVIIIRPDSSKVIPEYLAATINSPYVKTQINRLATGSVVLALTIDKVLGLKIPLPDFHTQNRLVKTFLKVKNEYITAKENFIKAEVNYNSFLNNFLEEGEK